MDYYNEKYGKLPQDKSGNNWGLQDYVNAGVDIFGDLAKIFGGSGSGGSDYSGVGWDMPRS